jgi:glycosyltransferase involved in cell wall biosynthesis
MKFSIIICTYNAVDSLSRTIDSILSQTNIDYKVFIIDGVSTDGTRDIIESYEKKMAGKLRWISKPDSGIYDAMNRGIDMSNGEWLYFLGSGDVFHNNHVLEQVAEKISKNPHKIFYGNVEMGKKGKIYDGEFTREKLIEKNICHQAIFFHRDVFKIVGKYDTKYLTLADWVHNMKWFNDKSIDSKYINILIAKYAPGGRSKTVFDKKFYNDFEDNEKKYFSQEYWEVFRRIKSREMRLVKSRTSWKLWEWNNKIKFAIFHPREFKKKYLKK